MAIPTIHYIRSCPLSYDVWLSSPRQDKSLEEGMQKILASETWTVQPTGRADTRVFTSSKDLFLSLKKQFKRGTALNMSAVLHELLHKVR